MVAQYAFVEDDLRTGRLVAPFATARADRARLLPRHPAHRQKPARLRAFEDWIMPEAAIVETRLAVPAA